MAFNSTFRYIDDVFSINNDNFHSYVDTIYPSELEIKDSTESDTSASYLDILLEKDSNGNLTTKLHISEIFWRGTLNNIQSIINNQAI